MSKAFEGIFPIGFGTSRMPFPDHKDQQHDFESAVQLVLYAIEHGINYIDTALGYSGNRAISVVREAIRRTDRKIYTTVKVMTRSGKPGDEGYYQTARSILRELGLEHASHFLLWSLMNNEELLYATAKGGLYDTASRLKEEGRIGHIGVSVHMSHEDILKVIDSGLFEFVMISYNLLTLDMRKVLDRAVEKNVDIIVMNPLYGGLIPQNPEMFSHARFSEQENVIQASIRAVLAHPAVKCVLAGAANSAQLDEYLSAVEDPVFPGNRMARLEAVKDRMMARGPLCTGCHYCADCPKGIHVPEIMNSRNVLSLLEASPSTDQLFFRQLYEAHNVYLESSENPCIQCGKCEKACTQHLPIIASVAETYATAGRTCGDRASQRHRLDELLNGKGYRKIGLWPASDASVKILNRYQEFFGKPPFEVCLFDSSKNQIGGMKAGLPIYGRESAVEEGVDCVLITSLRFCEEIYEQNKDLEKQGIAVKKLYRRGDVDWWWT